MGPHAREDSELGVPRPISRDGRGAPAVFLRSEEPPLPALLRILTLLSTDNTNIIVPASPTVRCTSVSRGNARCIQDRPVRTREIHLFRPIVLASLVVLGALIGGGGCVKSVIDTDCFDTIERTYHFQTPAEPSLQFHIDRCHLDAEACKELCQEALDRDNRDSEPTRCHVTFKSSDVSVNVSFEVVTDGKDCPVPPDVIFVGPAAFAPSGGSASGPLTLASPPITLPNASPIAPSIEFWARGPGARTLGPLWNGGRTCHA